jgi:hypothetical protein
LKKGEQVFSKWPTHEKIIGLIILAIMLFYGGGSIIHRIRESVTEQHAKATRAVWTPTPITLDGDEVYQVCKGEGVEECAAYDPDSDQVHPVAYYISPISACRSELPGAEAVCEGGYFKGYEKAELVLCMHRLSVSETLARSCAYTGGVTNNYYDATYELRLYVARTGELLDQTTLHTRGLSECPDQTIVQEGTEGTFRKILSPKPGQIEDFVAPYANP